MTDASTAQEEQLRTLGSEWLRLFNMNKRDELPEVERQMEAITATLDEHPDWYDYPCWCGECQSNA